jgi:nucleoid DNA-binding protein
VKGNQMALPLLTQSELVAEIAEDTGHSRQDVRAILRSLEESIVFHVGECDRVKIGSLLQVEPKLRPKTKKRMGRNPATGEEIVIAAKPASVRVAVRVLKGLKDSAPGTAKLRSRL